MRAFFYVVVYSGCVAWAAMMLAEAKAEKKRPTEVSRQ